jgi:hypothetical protein
VISDDWQLICVKRRLLESWTVKTDQGGKHVPTSRVPQLRHTFHSRRLSPAQGSIAGGRSTISTGH